jgi:hypothetical protein
MHIRMEETDDFGVKKKKMDSEDLDDGGEGEY